MADRYEPFETRAQGKLLLTGEYFVLDGALSLALPVRYGQTLQVLPSEKPGRLTWTSRDADGTVWFQAEFALPGLVPLSSTDPKTADILATVLKACRQQRPAFLSESTAFEVRTANEFPRAWGLGTSSTLIAAIAVWADVDPYPVLFDTFGGSGYDIACAYAPGPVLYHLEGQTPWIRTVVFEPVFAGQLYFVYLGKKQDSRAGIERYRERMKDNLARIGEVNDLTQAFLTADSLPAVEQVIREHENLIGEALGLVRAKDLYFNDFWGEIKSLGAWGGDFVLATSDRPEAETQTYFSSRGFFVFFPWREMVV